MHFKYCLILCSETFYCFDLYKWQVCVLCTVARMPKPVSTVESSTGTVSKKKDKSKKGKKQPLSKNDIGAPTNFQFVLTLLFCIILSPLGC